MREATGNLWTYPADFRVITTNGFVKRNGECVMGRGCAKEAKEKWPNLPKQLGDAIRQTGNGLNYFREYNLITFPVKHNWWEKADPELIKESVVDLNYLDQYSVDKVYVMPRPGCGNGGLRWEDIRPLLVCLSDNVVVITFS